MSLPLDLTPVLDEFLTQIECFDEVGTYQDHELVSVRQPNYTIVGVLIPPTNKDLQFFNEGEIQNGALVLYTYSTFQLYFHDLQSPTAEARQTFVIFRNQVYRIKQMSPRAHDGMHYKYNLVRDIRR